jgi:putative acetyltransferase
MHPDSVTIRQARLDDCADIAALHRLARQTAMPWLPDLHTPHEDLAFFRDRVFRECTIHIAGRVPIRAFCAARKGWIDHLYVHPAFQGRGLGSVLLSEAMRGEDRVRLWVFRRNLRALEFYQKRGFRQIATTEGDNEEGEPDALYEWTA